MTNLTEKQKKFAEEYVLNGFNAARAYKMAYGGSDKGATVNGCTLIKNPKILRYVDELEGQYREAGYSVGVSKKRIMKKLSEMLDATKPVIYNGSIVGETPDYGAINNAITTFAKLTGDFAAERKEITITDEDGVDLSKMTETERLEYKQKLLKELQG